MTASFNIFISKSAELDIEENYLWWAENRSKIQADRWYESILGAVQTLRSMPERCPMHDEVSADLGVPVRQLLFGLGGNAPTHRILFRVRDESVHILRVIHSARSGVRGPNE